MWGLGEQCVGQAGTGQESFQGEAVEDLGRLIGPGDLAVLQGGVGWGVEGLVWEADAQLRSPVSLPSQASDLFLPFPLPCCVAAAPHLSLGPELCFSAFIDCSLELPHCGGLGYLLVVGTRVGLGPGGEF